MNEIRRDAYHEGMRVRTKRTLSTLGDEIVGMISASYITNRVVHAKGRVIGMIAGFGGDLWKVEHPGERIAVYLYTDLEYDQGNPFVSAILDDD